MTNSSEQNQPYNDEIDLADVVRALWQGKWLVIGVTLATLALGIAYLVITPKNYTASLNIWALPDSQANVYDELNESKFIEADNRSLLALFVEDLETQSDNGLGFSLAFVTVTQSRLSFPTQVPGQLTPTVTDALELANQNVNQQLEINFSRHSDKLARNNTTAIEALDLERQREVALFAARQEQQIALLTEQARLARTINLDVGSFASYVNIETNYETIYENWYENFYETKANPEHSSYSSLGTQAAYLRGYIVLEKEIELIQSRKVEDFIPVLTRIEFLKSELLKNKELKKAQVILAKTPIGTDQFYAVEYDLSSIKYQSNSKTSLILALSILLGGMLGMFVLLIRNVLVKKD